MSPVFDVLIRDGTVVTPEGAQGLDLGLTEGRIVALLPRGAPAEAAEIIEAGGQHVLPGAIDIHCHVRSPAFPERGTVESETRAAAAGGITTLFEMPISKPCCNSAARVITRRDHFAQHALVDFALYAAPGDISEGALRASMDTGIIAFKIFTTAAPPGRDDEFAGLCFPDEGDQLAVLTALARTGLPVVVHAESEQLLAHFGRLGADLDPARASTHTALRPDICEAVAVSKLLTMNIRARAKLHIAHVTSALTVAVLRRFAGTSDFSAETCPHYLARTEEDVERVGVFAKINPPVRAQADQDALWSAIADGTIGHVTTDHASFAFAEKQAALGDFVNAPPGAPGLEILVPVMLDAAARGRIAIEAVAALLSGNAADRFRVPDKGRIAPGLLADLTIVDLRGETTVAAERLFTQAREVAQLYAGARFKGCIVRTILRGRTVFRDGEISCRPGFGQYVSPVCAPEEQAAA